MAHPRQPPCHRRICRCGIPSRPKSPSTRKKSPTSAWGRSTSSTRRLPEHPGSANKLPGRAVGAAEAAGAAEAVAEAAEAAEAAAAAGAAGAAAAAVRRGEFAASARFEHFLRTVGWAKNAHSGLCDALGGGAIPAWRRGQVLLTRRRGPFPLPRGHGARSQACANCETCVRAPFPTLHEVSDLAETCSGLTHSRELGLEVRVLTP